MFGGSELMLADVLIVGGDAGATGATGSPLLVALWPLSSTKPLT